MYLFLQMVLLGADFDRDPALPWAAAILARRDLGGQSKVDAIDGYILFGAGEMGER